MMNEKQETVADIVAEMCNYTNKYNDGYHTEYKVVQEAMREFVDRIEAAYRVETLRWVEANAGLAKLVDLEKMPLGNGAKMHEALEVAQETADELLKWCSNHYQELNCMGDRLKRAIRAALATPPRNCDVGTAEEQAQRFELFCCQAYCSKKCPLYGKPNIGGECGCAIEWAQMPYEKGETK